MTKPKVLIVNSYGGSLTKAVLDEGHPIIASMEDHNFGIDSQMLNFPDLTYHRDLHDWPLDMDLRDSIVIAHPPCSGFSTQNRSKSPEVRGKLSNAFACTTRLLDYVMPRRPEAIVIESVPGAMEGARPIHDFYAKNYGYDLYRVLQNAASFGTPQWRRRFWAVFVRQKPGRPQQFEFRLRHNIKYLGDVLDMNNVDPEKMTWHTKNWARQVELLRKKGMTEEKFREILKVSDDDFHRNIILILADYFGVPKGKGWPPWGDLHNHIMGGNFLSGAIHVLNRNSFAPTLLGT